MGFVEGELCTEMNYPLVCIGNKNTGSFDAISSVVKGL